MQPPLAKAEARAGQILAEMLGMVCHREYIREYAEQTVQSQVTLSPVSYVYIADVVGDRRAL